jgi:hypothetical protein
VSKARAIVTARFELVASAAAALEGMLRDLTQQISCTVLEVSTHAEPELQQASVAADPVEPAGAGAEGDGLDAEPVGIEDRPESLGRGSDDGEAGSVLRSQDGHLAQSADPGARGETSGDTLIVPTKE